MSTGWAIVVIVQWLAIVALAAVVLGLVRQGAPAAEQTAESRELLFQNQGPAVGSKLPPFTGRDGSGGTLNAAQIVGRPAVLLFLSATCLPCVRLADEIAGSDPGDLADSLIVVTAPDGHEKLRLPASVRVLVMPDKEVAEVFTIKGRPFAIAAGADGVIRTKQGVNTVAQLGGITASATSSRSPQVAAG
jgi:hypothetical protein